MIVKIGDVALSGQRSEGFYPKAVKFFTKSNWSHCFFIMNDVANKRTVLEADLKIQVVPFEKEYVEKEKDYYIIYRPIKATEEEKVKAADKIYLEYAGEIYGFMQIPWFVWDAFCDLIGWNSGKNWFPHGAICSEVLYDYLICLNDTYKQAFKHLNDKNRVSPEDIAKVIISRPDLFEFVLERK